MAIGSPAKRPSSRAEAAGEPETRLYRNAASVTRSVLFEFLLSGKRGTPVSAALPDCDRLGPLGKSSLSPYHYSGLPRPTNASAFFTSPTNSMFPQSRQRNAWIATFGQNVQNVVFAGRKYSHPWDCMPPGSILSPLHRRQRLDPGAGSPAPFGPCGGIALELIAASVSRAPPGIAFTPA